MHHQIFSRAIGGTGSWASRSWRWPQLTSDMFIERFETASFDQINLSRYTEGLPITCQFGQESRSGHLLAVTDEEGLVQIFNTKSAFMAQDAARVQSWQAHDNAVFDYQWINGDTQCLTSSGDQSVVMWDVEKMEKITTFKGHDCSVRSVAPCPGSPAQCASGARDGHIMIWDCRVNKKCNTNGAVKAIKYAHSLTSRSETRKHRRNTRAAGPKGVLDTQQSVTCVLYQTENMLISSGAMDGCVKFWDTRKWYSNSVNSLPTPVQTFEYPGLSNRLKVGLYTKGIVTMCMDPWKSQLFVSYTDNRVYRFDIIGQPKKPAEYVYAGHRNDTFYVRCVVSPDGKYLLSGSGKNTGVIWEVDRPQKQPVFLIGHTQDVSSVDWCPSDPCKLATLSDDLSLRVWRPDSRAPEIEDPSIMGFAYSAKPGKHCSRQSRVHIVQDEFPFRISETGCLQPSPEEIRINQMLLTSQPSRTRPVAEPAAERNSNPGQTVHNLCQSSERSPSKRGRYSSPVASTSRHGIWDSQGQSTPPLSRRRLALISENDSDTENGVQAKRRFSPRRCANISSSEKAANSAESVVSSPHRRVNLTSPEKTSTCAAGTSSSPYRQINFSSQKVPSDLAGGVPFPPRRRVNFTSPEKAANSGGGVPSSPHTPQNTGQLLPFSTYKSPLATRRIPVNSDAEQLQSPAVERVCLKSLDTNSPSKQCQGAQAIHSSPKKSSTTTSDLIVKSPMKSPLRRSPRKKVHSPSVLTFSSPTVNLPNSILDCMSKNSVPAPSRQEKKVDWLTNYRLSKGESAISPSSSNVVSSKISPSSASRKLFDSDSSASKGRDSTGGVRSVTPKRKSARLSADCFNDVTPKKRIRVDRPATPGSSGKKNVLRRSGASTTPNRKSSGAASPQTPGKNSILRYFQ